MTAAAADVRPSQALLDDLVLANKVLYGLNVVDAFGHISVRHDKRTNHYLMARHLPPGMVTVLVALPRLKMSSTLRPATS